VLPRPIIEDIEPSNLQDPKFGSRLAPLAGRVADDASAEQVAEAVFELWLEIDQALHPIIGHRGVAALYNRSLKLTQRAYPWVAIGHQGQLAAADPAALKVTLVQQAATEAAAGGSALFGAFHGLLSSLVGPALTEQLLSSVWAHSSAVASAQDPSP
jgi:hypothetical protein